MTYSNKAAQSLSNVQLFSIHKIDRSTGQVVERSFLITREELKDAWQEYKPNEQTEFKILHYNTGRYIEITEIE